MKDPGKVSALIIGLSLLQEYSCFITITYVFLVYVLKDTDIKVCFPNAWRLPIFKNQNIFSQLDYTHTPVEYHKV